MRFIRANRDTVALIEDGARFSDFLVDWAATPIRFLEQLRPESAGTCMCDGR
jgi:hypothetical protein